jgi:omega-hydroxypalmitate O-feruloyl transferase
LQSELWQVSGNTHGSQLDNANGEEPLLLRVNKKDPTLVPPSEETENGLYYLSNLDQNIAVTVQTIYCFKPQEQSNEQIFDMLRESLSRVLVNFYPLAGRLTINDEGKLIVDCTGEGAVFVEAEAECDLVKIGDITKPDPSMLGTLVYNIPGAKNILEIPPLVIQVCFFELIFNSSR